jgi:hypothetical protein
VEGAIGISTRAEIGADPETAPTVGTAQNMTALQREIHDFWFGIATYVKNLPVSSIYINHVLFKPLFPTLDSLSLCPQLSMDSCHCNATRQARRG